MTEPRIYVASLSDYNAGRLHGVWIDATQDPPGIWADINSMLAASPEFRAFPQGGPAEEWAIHDYEGFGSWKLSEWENIEKVSMVAQAIADHGDPYAAWLENTGGDSYDVSDFEAEYQGDYPSRAEFAEQWHEGVNSCDEYLWSYIDWDAVARDMEYGEFWFAQHEGGVYVYLSS